MRLFLPALYLILLTAFSPSCSVVKLCPVPGCQVRLLHAHNGVTFRGQPWWRHKKLNPKVGQSYVYTKDQNLIKKEYWWTKKKKADGDKSDKKSGHLAGIKARDPGKKNRDKDLEVEEPEEDKEEKDGY